MTDVICRFEGGDAGIVLAEHLPIGEAPVAFMPYRSLAHAHLAAAIADDGRATVELRESDKVEIYRVTAMTARTITLARVDSPPSDFSRPRPDER